MEDESKQNDIISEDKPLFEIWDNLDSLDNTILREIGNEAVWSLSSAKPGNGVQQLRDEDIETFWQSDGFQPHDINIHFHKKSRIKLFCFYVDFKVDDSYTPMGLSIRAGTGFHDLRDIVNITLENPRGWVYIPLSSIYQDNIDNDNDLRAHILQLRVHSSHQNGRDTHVRQVKIYGPRGALTMELNSELSGFTSIEFQQFSNVR